MMEEYKVCGPPLLQFCGSPYNSGFLPRFLPVVTGEDYFSHTGPIANSLPVKVEGYGYALGDLTEVIKLPELIQINVGLD